MNIWIDAIGGQKRNEEVEEIRVKWIENVKKKKIGTYDRKVKMKMESKFQLSIENLKA